MSRLVPMFGPTLVSAGSDMPELFRHLMQRDQKLKALWNGHGITNGADSPADYDFSLVRRLMALGYRNFDDLATVLAARPEGAVRRGGMGEDYIRGTIARALSN